MNRVDPRVGFIFMKIKMAKTQLSVRRVNNPFEYDRSIVNRLYGQGFHMVPHARSFPLRKRMVPHARALPLRKHQARPTQFSAGKRQQLQFVQPQRVYSAVQSSTSSRSTLDH